MISGLIKGKSCIMFKKKGLFLVLLIFLINCFVPTTLNAQESRDISAYFPETIYVSLQKSGAIERLPDGTVFEGFPGAHYLSVGPDAKAMIVSGFKTGNVYIADARTAKKEATLKIGKVVQGVKIGPQGKYALAINASGGSVAVIDLNKDQVIQSIKVGKAPHNARFSEDGRLAYVTIQGENKVVVLDMVTLEKVKEIPVSGLVGPHNLDLSADGRYLWIRNKPTQSTTDGHAAMINIASGQTVRNLKVGPFHGGIDLGGSGSNAITTDIGSNTVDVIDPNGLSILKTIEVGDGPHGIRYSPEEKWAYVAATRANEVDVINMKTLKVAKRMKVKGEFPFWIALEGNE